MNEKRNEEGEPGKKEEREGAFSSHLCASCLYMYFIAALILTALGRLEDRCDVSKGGPASTPQQKHFRPHLY